MKIIINEAYGGFGIKQKIMTRYAELKGIEVEFKRIFGQTSCYEIIRDNEGNVLQRRIVQEETLRRDPTLIQIVEELGTEAKQCCSILKIVDIPTGTKYRIVEYDGWESIQTEADIVWEIAE